MCKFYFIIGIYFANNSSYGHMGKLFIYFFFFFFFFFFLHLLLLDLQGNVAFIKFL